MTNATRDGILTDRIALFAASLSCVVALHCARPEQSSREEPAPREAHVAKEESTRNEAPSTRIIGGGCDGCEAIYEGMPETVSPRTAIASESEPGERLEISGTVYQRDGKTPAPGVILYLHQTDTTGHYTPAPGATGLTARDGHLRGWLKSGERGEYSFTTIRPAPYPNATIPAHIHVTVKEPGKNEYYIDDFLFDDDPLLVERERARLENRAGSGIITLTRRNGILTATRDIILGMNIPDYD